MHDGTQALESAAWSAAYSSATSDEVALLEADRPGWRRTLERLLDETEDNLDVGPPAHRPRARAGGRRLRGGAGTSWRRPTTS